MELAKMQKMWQGSVKSYAVGFFSSLIITSLAFLLVHFRAFPTHILMVVISMLAITQAIFQLIYFLHLKKGSKPHWEIIVFFTMLIILLIITIGTLWIMYDLNARMMSMPQEMTNP